MRYFLFLILLLSAILVFYSLTTKNIETDPYNCGAKGYVCPTQTVCRQGICVEQ